MEIEYLQLLKAFIQVLKPKFVVETGTFKGICAKEIAQELLKTRVHGAILYTVEIKKTWQETIKKRLETFENIKIINDDSVIFLENFTKKIDILILDTEINLRVQEARIILKNDLLADDGIIIIHDTSNFRPCSESAQMRNDILTLAKKYNFSCVNFPFSRGLTLLKKNTLA